MKIIDGRSLAKEIKSELKRETQKFIKQGGKTPHLAAVLVGDDGASQAYVRNKIKSCERVGFESTLIKKKSTIQEDELLEIVDGLNKNEDIDGFIVQLPLPDHIDESKVTLAIDPVKDVDGFHPMNLGRMVIGLPCYIPATPLGMITMMERYNIKTEGKNVVVLGRSNIVGTPISILLSQKTKWGNATVTLCHSRTKDLVSEVQRADIIIAAIGIPRFVTSDMVKEGAVVIDVGINRIDAPDTKKGYKLVGDVDFDEVAAKASYITPVPGGVGQMTVTSLLMNTLKAARGEIYPGG
ncbi:bifunctional 5,10-methylenetetrahydrofolate dehydrogenase/5,10-methenyltetrahydrofolate cyclohydrolase [Membranicola marinus]|uniref:Bifunctional protein FolD n=1 Tax=Membranihabitans marinus TaxID=1227546 RepID=A0A953LAJ3_9BACT|nr:bifunctional 5,10-methylenetetrahydrofolate dehydrogenase/5,10-methenyltetrahydrofolate cyclohydrolase [Membranihabitans marinus]MBY5960015.1 bifunctional 5,10-methylenetetrahydrofolate dehydrogenase/5,10-methenyltetrahydrofolate cyclohydrolase [Membranihabitans marinus]